MVEPTIVTRYCGGAPNAFRTGVPLAPAQVSVYRDSGELAAPCRYDQGRFCRLTEGEGATLSPCSPTLVDVLDDGVGLHSSTTSVFGSRETVGLNLPRKTPEVYDPADFKDASTPVAQISLDGSEDRRHKARITLGDVALSVIIGWPIAAYDLFLRPEPKD